MKTIAAVLAFVFVGCSSEPDKYTWGTVSEQLSVEYCSALSRCLWIDQSDIGRCSEHTLYHLCEYSETCGVELDQKAVQPKLESCLAAINEVTDPASDQCFFIGYFGAVPPVCNEVLELAPPEQK